ncbi:MAG TPA: NfeD family protein, partial [Actinomycetota bacterium]|nr:NfeD family protein [Actinomycetota bacterium]
ASAQQRPTPIEVVEVEGPLDRVLVAYLEDVLAEAEAAGAVVVLELDSPGALDQPPLALAARVAGARVPVIAWVGPAPARASGAAMLLMHAASLAAVSPGSQTGPLHPLDLARPELRPPALPATIAGWVEARGTETDLGGRDRALTAAEARHRGIAQVTATSVPELLARIDGRTVRTADGPVTLATRIATDPARGPGVAIRFREPGPAQRILHGVATPSAVYLLLVLGLAALAFELTQPGFGFAGISGLVLLGLAAYGLTAVPVWWPGLVLLVGGVVGMALDVQLRRLGPLTYGGLVAFAAGSWLAWRDVSEAIDLAWWVIALATVASFLYYGFALTVALRARERIASTQLGLVGLVGEARGDLAPEGPVAVKGALWRGRSADGPIPKGTRVRVRGVDGLILRVEPEPGED